MATVGEVREANAKPPEGGRGENAVVRLMFYLRSPMLEGEL